MSTTRTSSPGADGFSSTTGAGFRFRIASNTTPVVAPENACRPVAISYSTAPKLNRSVRASSPSPRTCSGDMYATVPSAVPGLVSSGAASVGSADTLAAATSCVSFASPKSSTFA